MTTACGTCRPDRMTEHDTEVADRFRAFLAVAGPAATFRLSRRPPAARYHVRFLAWRTSSEALELSARLEALRG